MREARERGALVFAIVASMMQEPGWPDRYMVHTRWHGWLEFKGARTPATTKQKLVIREINRRAPGTAYIVRFPGLVQDWQGTTLGEFDGTGADLINLLEMLNGERDTATT